MAMTFLCQLLTLMALKLHVISPLLLTLELVSPLLVTANSASCANTPDLPFTPLLISPLALILQLVDRSSSY